MSDTKTRIASNIKDKDLINVRRQELVNAAVELFVKKGFHKTTVREIAKEFGMSMGALYDYIRTKEDILFLVCDHIHKSVSDKLQSSLVSKRKSEERHTGLLHHNRRDSGLFAPPLSGDKVSQPYGQELYSLGGKGARSYLRGYY